MTTPVRCERDGALLIVTIDNPPVNALGQAVRAGLMGAVTLGNTDHDIRALVLRSTGTVFIGGADIKEFSGPRLDPPLNVVCHAIEACRVPIVAALQGSALGGGFEVALASHYRVASPTLEVAFPEVLLGLLPGAGGTQRASRLCGAELALDLMLTGRRLGAPDAQLAGLVDRVHDDAFAESVQWARELGARGATPPRARDGRALHDHVASMRVVDATRATLASRFPGLYSPARIVDCVETAITRSFDEGAEYEAAAFLDCLASPQRAALVHLFFAEREVKQSVAEGVDLAAIGASLNAAREAAFEKARDGDMRAMALEAQRLLASGVAKRAADCDVASVRYAEVPRVTGGVLWWLASVT